MTDLLLKTVNGDDEFALERIYDDGIDVIYRVSHYVVESFNNSIEIYVATFDSMQEAKRAYYYEVMQFELDFFFDDLKEHAFSEMIAEISSFEPERGKTNIV